jgi:hypothetical protein
VRVTPSTTWMRATQPAELVPAARLDPSDDVVGAGKIVGPLDPVEVADRLGDLSGAAHLGLDEHIGAEHSRATFRV